MFFKSVFTNPAAGLLIFVFLNQAAAGILPENAFSEDAAGTTAASFLKTPPGARFEAMGGGGISLPGPGSLFYNPAGMKSESKSVFEFSYETMLEDSYRTALSAVRGGGSAFYGAGILFWGSTPLKGYDSRGDFSGYFSAEDLAAYFGFSSEGAFARFGLNFKLIRSQIAGESGYSFAFDAGLLARDEKPWGSDIAVAVRNVGPPLKVGARSAPLPAELSLSFLNHYTPDLDIMFEGKMPSDNKPYLIAAGEYSVGDILFLRAGVNFKNNSELGFMGIFSSGFGLSVNAVDLDYAFVPYGDLGKTHRLSFSLGFGRNPAYGRGPEKISEEKDMVKRELRESFAIKTATAAGKAVTGKPAVALINFRAGRGVSENRALMVTGMVESELLRGGKVILVERTEVEYILLEKKFSASGFIPESKAASFGEMLAAEFIILGQILKSEDGYRIFIKAISVKTGEVAASVSVLAPGDYRLGTAAKDLAGKIARSLGCATPD